MAINRYCVYKKKGKLTENIHLQPVIKMMSMNQAESSVFWLKIKEESLPRPTTWHLVKSQLLQRPTVQNVLLKATLFLCCTVHILVHRKDMSSL